MQTLHDGDVITSKLAVATTSGLVYRFGDMVGVAANSKDANQDNEFIAEGVVQVAKPSGETWADGASVYAVGAAGGAVSLTETSATGAIHIGNVHAHVEGVMQANFAGQTSGIIRLSGAPRVIA